MPKAPAPPVAPTEHPEPPLGPPALASRRAATERPPQGPPHQHNGVNDPTAPLGNTVQPEPRREDFTTKEAYIKALTMRIYTQLMESPEPHETVPLQMGLVASPTHFCAALAALTPHDITKPTILRLCTNVARTQRKSNPANWARLATNKLKAINISDIASLTVNLGSLNAQLATAARSTFHKITLQGFRTELTTIEAIARDPSKSPYGDAPLIPIPSPLRPLFRSIAATLGHAALEPQSNDWIDAIIHKLTLININSVEALHLNIANINNLLNDATPPQEMLFTRTLQALKLELPNHWPARQTSTSQSLQHIFEAVAWRQFNYAPTTWSHTMIASLASVNITTTAGLAQQLHNISHLFPQDETARQRFTPQVIAALDNVLTTAPSGNPGKRQGMGVRSQQPPPKRHREHAAHRRTQPRDIQELLNLLSDRGLWNITDLRQSMNIRSDDTLLTHLRLPPNTCLKLAIQGECMNTTCPRLHPTDIGTLATTRLATGLQALITSDFRPRPRGPPPR